jgi:hypothetical protein
MEMIRMAKRARIEVVAYVELDDDETHAGLQAELRREPMVLGEVIEGGRFTVFVTDIGDGTALPASPASRDMTGEG